MEESPPDSLMDQVMAVMTEAFDPEFNEAWTRKQVGDALALPSGHLLAIDGDGSISDGSRPVVGFALARSAPGDEELLLIAISPHHRGRGLAKQLLEHMKSAAGKRGAEQIFLEVRENNPARHLYESLGFSPIGRRREYYRTRSGTKLDAITYAIALTHRNNK